MVILKPKVIKLGNSTNFDPMNITYHRRDAKPHKTEKLGDPRGADFIHNCLTCSRWTSCRDSHKGANFRCSRFREAVIEPTDLDTLFKQAESEDYLKEEDIFKYDKSTDEDSIIDMISNVLDSNIPVPPDLRINDGEIPRAKNFYQWAMDPNFAKSGLPPFPRQIEIGLKAMGEWCPRCSEVDWFDNMPVDAPLPTIREKVVLLEWGVCPKCKVGRAELFANEELPCYYGIVGLAGQRCVTGDTLIPTTHGFQYMEDLVHPYYEEGFNAYVHPSPYKPLEVCLENGDTQKPSDFYISSPAKTIKIVTRRGFEIEGSFDHPVMTERGFIKLKDLRKDDLLILHGGQNLWAFEDKLTIDEAMLLLSDKDIDCLPKDVLQSTRAVVTAFLKMLWLKIGSKDGYYFQYKTNSHKLAKELQIVLLNLGIISELYESNNLYVVSMSRSDAINGFDKAIVRQLPTTLPITTDYVKIKTLCVSGVDKVTYDFTVPGTHRFMANGLLNHNSAKTTSVILWDSYDLHKTLKLPSPQTVYGILDTTPITSTFAATTFAQAVDNVWTPYKSTLTDTPWFKNYHKFLEMRGEELGEELFTIGEHMVRYRHRNLVLAPSGPNKRTMRGRSRRSGVVDEIGWFKTAKKSGKVGEELELMDAKGVFDALDNSLLTLKNAHRRRIDEGYNDIPKPMMYIVSSPSKYNDFIMSSYRLYRNSPERLAFKYETWNFNPLYKKKDFKEAYRLRPVETARDFECNPPLGEGLFITDHKSLVKAFSHGNNKITTTAKKALSRSKVPMTNASVQIITNSLPTYGTILCVDIGLVNNSLSFSIIGPADDFDTEILPEDRGTLQNPVKVFAVGEVIPKADTRISLTSVYTDCWIPLLEPFNVQYFVSDRFQNAKIATDIEEGYDVTPIEHKCTWEDFEATRDLIDSGNLLLPRLTMPFDDTLKTTLDTYPECFRGKPVDHLAWQFANVREQTNVTVLKGEGGTDDTFRTIVLGVALMQDQEILDELLAYDGGVEQAASKDFLGMVVKVKGGSASPANGGSGRSSALGAVKKLGR